MNFTINVVTSKEIEERLNQWADWVIRGRQVSGGMGYPSSSIEGRLKDLGVLIRVPGRHPSIPENTIAESMDRIIEALFKWNYQLAIAVRAKYTGSICLVVKAKLPDKYGNEFYEIQEVRRLMSSKIGDVAKALGISVRALEDQLMKARNFIAGQLSYIDENKIRRAA